MVDAWSTRGKPLAAKLEYYTEYCPTTGCWLWTGAHDAKGYGHLNFGRKIQKAHRLSFELHRSRIPHGMVLDHLCRQPECINPQHLEVTTNRENCTRGRVSKLRGGRQSEHTGVHWEPRNQKWYAQVRIKGKQTYLGAYASEADAAKAYIDALRCPDIYVD